VPFNLATYNLGFGLQSWSRTSAAYCQTNTSASDYGMCYNISYKAYFVQTDTSTYPVGSLPCESAGNCVRLTSVYYDYTLQTVMDLSGVNKQIIIKQFYSRTHTNVALYTGDAYFAGFVVPYKGDYPPFGHYGYINAVNAYMGHDTIYNLWVYRGRYTIPVGEVREIQVNDSILSTKFDLHIILRNSNNIYFASMAFATVFYESSPVAVIPLDYSEYLRYSELRRTFGYSADGINQPGWNADDIINVLKELFPDRAWMVYDDKDSTLYLWNVDFSDVPEWLLEKIDPTAVKVLKSPPSPEPEKSLFTELEKRNYVGETA